MQKTACAVLVMSVASTCAFAVDGQVLINQSTLNAAGGTYTITLPGSYKLSGNLVAPANQQAIVVAANNVVLDLNGFSVTCSHQQVVSFFRCVGDSAFSGVSDVSVRNGIVVVSATASGSSATILSLNNSTNIIVEEVHVKMNSPSVNGFVGLSIGSGSIVRHNIIPPNGSFIGGLGVSFPSLIEGNITGGIVTFGAGCIAVNNIGTITAF